jgi:poly(A) polymerase
MRTSKLKRFMARETFCDELELHRVDCESSNGNLENYHFLRAKAEEFASEPLIPPPIITGHDLIERDIPSGPRYSEILRRAQDLQLEGTLTSRDEALQWLETELL